MGLEIGGKELSLKYFFVSIVDRFVITKRMLEISGVTSICHCNSDTGHCL